MMKSKSVETDIGITCPYCKGHFQNKDTEQLVQRGFDESAIEINRLEYELAKSQDSHIKRIVELENKLSELEQA
jgi:hypothetical protein